MSWNEERVEKLKTWWAEGQTASQIADKLGNVSRNAVIGKVYRLGLSGRGRPVRSPSTPAPRNAPRPAARRR